jgi:hypothetical protein
MKDGAGLASAVFLGSVVWFDFLTGEPPPATRGAILATNPPFNRADAFLARALALLDAGHLRGVVLLFRGDQSQLAPPKPKRRREPVPPDPNGLLTLAQAARRLGVSQKLLRDYVPFGIVLTDKDGATVLRHAYKLGLEGIVSKQKATADSVRLTKFSDCERYRFRHRLAASGDKELSIRSSAVRVVFWQQLPFRAVKITGKSGGPEHTARVERFNAGAFGSRPGGFKEGHGPMGPDAPLAPIEPTSEKRVGLHYTPFRLIAP